MAARVLEAWHCTLGTILTFSWVPRSHSPSGGLELKPRTREETGGKITAGVETLVPLPLHHVTSHSLPGPAEGGKKSQSVQRLEL